MKLSKQDYARGAHRPGPPAGDTRPAKPVAGQTAHHPVGVAPFDGPAKGHGDPPPVAGHNTRRAKSAFTDAGGGASERADTGGDRPDQSPIASGRNSHPGEQYVRLRILVRGDQLSVVDSHLVDGPLSQSSTFATTRAYDVTYEDRLLHAGAVPDLGMQRSFANPDGPAEQHGHHLTPRDVSEFSARVPAGEITPDTIAGIGVTLHRVEEATSVARLGSAPLATQFEGRITPTARLVGLPESTLPGAIEARGGRTGRGARGN